MTTPAFYTREGEYFVPTGIGVSPWNGHSQFGVALAGLVAHALEEIPSPVPMRWARLTLDILGAVPMEPLVPVTRILREGKRLQLIEMELQAAGRAWVKASAVRLRSDATPGELSAPGYPFPESEPVRRRMDWVEIIRVAGDLEQPGPGAQWVRFRCEVEAGKPLLPLERLIMVADFGSGTAPLLPFSEWTFANVDISLHLMRPPRGEWLLVDSASETAGDGIGLARSALSDREGLIARSCQTLFLDRRRPAPA